MKNLLNKNNYSTANTRIFSTSKWLIFALIIFINYSALSQNNQLNFTNFNVDQGLSQGNVLAIFQDSRGFIWIGTEDGLNCYDGYSFTVYKNEKNDTATISNNVITAIKEDSKGNIWISTWNGLNKYDPIKEQFISFKNNTDNNNSLSDSYIYSFDIDKNDNLWIGTANGLNYFNTETLQFKRFYSKSDASTLPGNTISTIKIINDHQVWIGTETTGLAIFNTQSNAFITLPSDLKAALQQTTIKTINNDKNGNIWIGTFQGLFITNTQLETPKHYTKHTSKPNCICSNEIYCITFDQNNNGWLATDNGLSVFNAAQNNFTNHLADNNNDLSLSQNILRSVVFDKDNRIWIGSMFGGVDMYDPNKNMFKSWSNQKDNPFSLAHNNVQNFAEAKHENFWVATDGGGICLYNRNNNTFGNFQAQPNGNNGLNSNKVIALCNNNDELWIGSWDGGVVIYNTKTKIFKPYTHDPANKNSLSSNHVFYIYKDLHQRIWVATWDKGINLYDQENDQFIRLFNQGDDFIPEVSYLVEDKMNNLWIASQGEGLFKYNLNDKSTKQYTIDEKNPNALNSEIVYSLFIDSKERLWIGTKNGLNLHLGNGEFKAYTSKNGLPNNIIYGIEEDNNGNLWLSTNFGLSRFNIESEKFRNFTHKDGLQGSQFNRRAVKKLASGEILFGGINGFTLINPNNIKENTIPPRVYFTQLKVGNQIITPNNNNNILTNSIAYTKSLKLMHFQNFLSFSYVGLNYTQSDKNKYQYKLEGLDDKWSDWTSNRSTSYTNLNPGEYTFKVQAINSDGVLAQTQSAINISIIAPWWKRLWFRLLFIATISSIVVFAYRLRIKNIKKQRKILQSTVENRTHELKKIMKITKEQSEKISELGDILKNRSEELSIGAENQSQTTTIIERSIDELAQHTNNTQNNAKKTDIITENTLRELELIKISTEKNIKEISSIAEKTNILNEIFMQTNILAINAAIEAQHAGVHGKGFGTVADEVRKLADRSRDASQEIMLSSKIGANATKEDGERLIHFIPEISKAAQLIKEIADASKEQHATITNINSSLKEFFKASNEHTATAKEIAAISVTLDELARYLKEHMMSVEL